MSSKRLVLVKLLGVPGSGKTHFSRALAKKMNLVHLNSDAMRLAIFKSTEETTRIYNSDDRSILNTYVFGALDYVASQILSRGTGVIYDACNNSRAERASIDKIGARFNALSVTAWIQTPHDIALKRGQERSESDSQRKLYENDMAEAITEHAKNIEAPTDDERSVILNGETSVEEQVEAFIKFIEGLPM